MLEQELNEKLNNQQLKVDEISKANSKNIQSHYAFNKPIIPPVCTFTFMLCYPTPYVYFEEVGLYRGHSVRLSVFSFSSPVPLP